RAAPLCDLAADVRASTPTAAARLVVPDAAALRAELGRARAAVARGAHRALERRRERLSLLHARLRAGPQLLVERRRGRLAAAAGRPRALSPHAPLRPRD